MVSNTVMNIISTTTLFFTHNTGTLAALYGEDEIDAIMGAWTKYKSEQEKKVFAETAKGRAISAGYDKILLGFVEMYGAALWSEGVWDSLNDEVYSRVVTAIMKEEHFVESVNELVKSTKGVRSATKAPSNRNKSAYLYCCQHFRALVKGANPAFTPQQVTHALGEKWKSIQTAEDDESKELFQRFTEVARLDKERYEKEHPKPEKVKKVRSPPKSPKRKGPPRGKSAWVIFCDIKRADVKAELGEGITNKDVMHKLGEMWASEDYTQIKILAEQRSIEDKQRVKDLVAAQSENVTTPEKLEVEIAPSAPVKDTLVKKTVSDDAVMSVTKKLDILLGGLDDDDEDEDEDEDECLGCETGLDGDYGHRHPVTGEYYKNCCCAPEDSFLIIEE
jgi:hypothetical protein